MRSVRAGRSTGGLAAVVAIGVLAVVVVLLAVFALRQPANPDAGQVPGPVPTWGAQRTPTPTPTPTGSSSPTPGAVVPDPQLVDMLDAQSGVRAMTGNCGGVKPQIEMTTDGGATWTKTDLGDIDARQVLAVSFTSTDQIDLVVADATCTATMVTSYTGGQYWQAYPERLAESTYVDPGDPLIVHYLGSALPSPCPAEQVVSSSSGPIVSCVDGSAQAYSASSAAWQTIASAGVVAIAADDETLLVAIESDPTCPGILIQSTATASSPALSSLSCLTPEAVQSGVTLSLDGGLAWYWSNSTFLRSPDGGATWLPTA